MNRKAILIGCPGIVGREGYLRGVTKDIDSYAKYLTSSIGGAWYPNDVIMLNNPNKAKLIEFLKGLPLSDYLFMVYSGHGWQKNPDSPSLISLNDSEDISITEILAITKSKSNRQLLILDSCRSYPAQQIQMSEKRAYREDSAENLSRSRLLFDKYLEISDEGFCSLYSASKGQAAQEDGNGGVFTQSLIQSSLNYGTGVLTINKAFNNAVAFMDEHFETIQVPEYNGGRRNNHFPFAVII